ncbi:alpha/beta hydrolase fold protein [Roseovarius litorisediminis]|uniref:Alpha/beta hydrolase fold protein n=1 Tax=Roseovarius litorisediminis TaxID=1312363 RepID=A0A1Y5SUI1_9RHOB|nr:hypothetical protein [Roseovarius litorisediminis]SLN48749.1 alpha/beta hydrolase fold protein [Roseovarius litorisediminis]
MTTGSTAQEFDAYTLFDDVPYGTAMLNGTETILHAALYLPNSYSAPPPLLLWLHDGAFKFGSYKQRICGRVGRRMARAGIAVAAIQYRLNATPEDLSPTVRDQFDELMGKSTRLIRNGLTHHRSLAAMEDCVVFLNWAEQQADLYGWSGGRVIGGMSAGGITALNALFTAPSLGLNRPPVAGVFCLSGGYTYPDLVHAPTQTRVLALHNPDDRRVSIRGVRMLKEKLGDRMELLESDSMIHGRIALTPDERPMVSFARLSEFVRKAVNQ